MHLSLRSYGQLALNSELVIAWKAAGPHYQRIQHLLTEARALRMSMVLVGLPGYFWTQCPRRDTIDDLDLQSCVCDAAMSVRNTTVLVSCQADDICKWQLLARASQPTCGGARAKQQGGLPNSLSMNWTSMAKELIRPNGVTRHWLS
eukprot:8142425-Pyramimonas_sp.AAC.2